MWMGAASDRGSVHNNNTCRPISSYCQSCLKLAGQSRTGGEDLYCIYHASGVQVKWVPYLGRTLPVMVNLVARDNVSAKCWGVLIRDTRWQVRGSIDHSLQLSSPRIPHVRRDFLIARTYAWQSPNHTLQPGHTPPTLRLTDCKKAVHHSVICKLASGNLLCSLTEQHSIITSGETLPTSKDVRLQG